MNAAHDFDASGGCATQTCPRARTEEIPVCQLRAPSFSPAPPHGLGTLMRGLLPAYGYDLRLLDLTPIEGEPDAVTADLGDKDALREAVRGVDAVIHLAGISLEASFDKILHSNIEGTYNLYEAAREEGVGRIVFASSNHAVGYTPYPRDGDPLIPVETPAAPTPSTAFRSPSARTWPSSTGRSTASRPSPCGSAPASWSRLRCGCCPCG